MESNRRKQQYDSVMKETRKLVIIGAGGFGAEALWLAEDMNRSGNTDIDWDILGFADDNPERKGEVFHGLPVLGTTKALCRELGNEIYFHSAVGPNANRKRLAAMLHERNVKLATLVHPSVIFHRTAKVGEGSFIGAGSVVAPEAKIGNSVIINTLAGIGHDSIIGDFVNICPGAKVNGECKIDELAFLGSNCSIQPGKTVGQGATVGANSFVVRSVKPHSIVQGAPARTVIHSKVRQS